MFGLDFLFSTALFALPLAGIPILLHLLYRRKSPVMQFSTIRFLKISVQQTAARKKVQRWLLLACRTILLAMLIAAVAQPRIRPSSVWAASPQSLAAAIVVDTSYSMQLRDGGTPLIATADAMIQELLTGQLHDANVAVFRSAPADASDPQQIVVREQEAGAVGSHLTWTPLVPQPSAKPLIDRVPAALEFLKRSKAADQRLIVISDFQKRDFPHALPEFDPARVLMIDLHPTDPRSAGVTRISTEPARPTPGIGSEVIVEVAGKPNTEALVSLAITTRDDRTLHQSAAQPAKIDSSGFGRTRFPVRLPAERWMLAKASLVNDDDMPWDNTRSLLVEVPPKQVVSLLQSAESPGAMQFLRLALDPSEGTSNVWPVTVRVGATIAPEASVAVMLIDKWPDAVAIARLAQFTRNGGTLVLFIRPGLQTTWAVLPDAQKHAMLELLPAEPLPDAMEVPCSAGIAAMADPLLTGLTDARYQVGSIVAKRYVPFASAEQTGTPLLTLFPQTPGPGARPTGLLFRKALSAGTIFTFATIPNADLATHPVFLPLLVRMALKPAGDRDPHNAEIGQSISVGGQGFENITQLWIHNPQGAVFPAQLASDSAGRRFTFDHADFPGLYAWTKPNEQDVLAVSNVQPPSSESQLAYRPANTVAPPGPNVVIGRSLEDLRGQIASMSEPSPQWSIPIAIVMVLLCFEALMGATSGLWKITGRAETAPTGVQSAATSAA